MRFAKLHGLGNDFVLVDLRAALQSVAAPDSAFAQRVCDRHRGVGADGVLTLLPATEAEASGASVSGASQAARLVIHNPDGSRPEMCGNGARVAALWMATRGCTRPGSAEVLLLTDAGPRPCAVEAGEAGLGVVEVGMGQPRVEAPRLLPLLGAHFETIPVSMGNPHLVFFLGEKPPRALSDLALGEGPALCRQEDANIELVQSLGPQRFAAAVWERGAGLTQACGTGACAVAAAAIARGEARGDLPITVDLPGGRLTLRLDDQGAIRMLGPAELVYFGEL